MFFNGLAQKRAKVKNKSESRTSTSNFKEKSSWIFGLGWNIVDDNGSPFKKLFDVSNAWSMRWYPAQITAEVIGKKGWTFGGSFSYDKYKSGKTINSQVISGSFLFFAFDGFAKYHLKEKIKMNPRFDPYFPMGLGYTLRFISPYNSTATFNLGFGINYWLGKNVGINIQSVAKFGLRSPIIKTGSNYLQHSFGFVFVLDRSVKKRYSFVKPRYPWVHDKRGNMERK